MNLKKTVLAMACLATLGVVVPRNTVFAQYGQQTQRQRELQQQRELERQQQQRHHELEQLLQRYLREQQSQRQQWQQHRRIVVWNVQVVNAATFERMLYTDVRNQAPGEIFGAHEWVALTVHGVCGQEEARWNIRRQLGFPVDSDTRTVGGVSQRIIWGDVMVLDYATARERTTVGPRAMVQPAIVEQEERRRLLQIR